MKKVRYLLLLRTLEDSKDSNMPKNTHSIEVKRSSFVLHVTYHNCTFHLNTKMYQESPDSPSLCVILGAYPWWVQDKD